MKNVDAKKRDWKKETDRDEITEGEEEPGIEKVGRKEEERETKKA